jgi:hypothetical protein
LLFDIEPSDVDHESRDADHRDHGDHDEDGGLALVPSRESGRGADAGVA